MTWTSYCRLLLAALLLLPALSVTGQVSTTKPIKVEALKPKKEQFKGEVLAASRQTITVRSRDNYNLVRTFTYDTELAAKINKQFSENKIYQHGDRVRIEYLSGTDKAVKIKGKPGQNR
jgi:hypothetical protein